MILKPQVRVQQSDRHQTWLADCCDTPEIAMETIKVHPMRRKDRNPKMLSSVYCVNCDTTIIDLSYRK